MSAVESQDSWNFRLGHFSLQKIWKMGHRAASAAADARACRRLAAVVCLLACALVAQPARSQTVVATPTVGSGPFAAAVNPVTNQVYVVNSGGGTSSGTVSVIDSATDTVVATPTVGSDPNAVAVDPVTNQVYVANYGGNTVSVIDGATNTVVATPTVGSGPSAVAVNPVTNQVYVANYGGNTVSVIDGATNQVGSVTVGTNPWAVAVNPVTNQVYVANLGTSSSTVSVIDGATNTVVATPTVGTNPRAVAVNPVTNQVYVANTVSDTVSVISQQPVNPIPIDTDITPLSGNATGSFAPSFTFSASSGFFPTAPPPDGLYFQADTWQGPWIQATNDGDGTFSGSIPSAQVLQPGFHILYAYSTDGMGSSNASYYADLSPLISNITAYGFLVAPATAVISPSSLDFGSVPLTLPSISQKVTLSATGGPLDISQVTITGNNAGDFSELDNCDGTLAVGSSCKISVTFTPSSSGAETATLTVTDDAGGTAGTQQTVQLAGTGSLTATTTTLASSATTATVGSTVTFTATASSSSGTPTGTVTFYNGTTKLGTGTLDGSGVATFTTTFATAGTYTITATYGGDTTFDTSTSASFTETIVAQATAKLSPTSLNFGSVPVTFASVSQDVTLSATAGPLDISQVTVGGQNAGDFSELNNCDGTLAAGSSCTISVTFTPSSTGLESATLTVTDDAGGTAGTQQSVSLTGTGTLTATTTTLASSATTGTVGSAVTFTATVSSSAGTPTGTVTFYNNGTTELGTGTLSSGVATFTTTFTAGTYTVTATYGGVSPFASSTSAPLTETGSLTATTTTLASSATTASVGSAVTFTATVSSSAGTPTGTVTFYNNGTTVIGTETLSSGVATFIPTFTTAGTYTVTATYIGDTKFAASTSAPLTETIKKGKGGGGGGGGHKTSNPHKP